MTADQVVQVESSLGWTSKRRFPSKRLTRSRAASGFLVVPVLVPVLLLALAGRSAAQDTWTPTSTTNPPTGRNAHTALWTGSKMVVWGGSPDGSSGLNTGSIYDPVADAWTTTSTTNAPTGRARHTAVWTGSKMIVWGGATSGWVSTGGVYDPVTDGGRRYRRQVLPRPATTTWQCGRARRWSSGADRAAQAMSTRGVSTTL